MPLQLRTNPYAGVNAHLQSYLQTPGTEEQPSQYSSFHAHHVNDIARFLNRVLPNNYVARTEQSLQLTWVDSDYHQQRPRPDISIYQQVQSTQTEAVAEMIVDPVALRISDTVDPERDFVPSVVIHTTEQDKIGSVVARVELLSPSNMYNRNGYTDYRQSRNRALFSGVVLVEINYLHEFTPPLLRVPVYATHSTAKPYAIYVSDPRLQVEAGPVYVYGAGIDEALPPFTIPLVGGEQLDFDLGAVYHTTYEEGRWWKNVDYSQPPLRFESYTLRDQEIIRAKMTQIAAESV